MMNPASFLTCNASTTLRQHGPWKIQDWYRFLSDVFPIEKRTVPFLLASKYYNIYIYVYIYNIITFVSYQDPHKPSQVGPFCNGSCQCLIHHQPRANRPLLLDHECQTNPQRSRPTGKECKNHRKTMEKRCLNP